MDGEKKTLQG